MYGSLYYNERINPLAMKFSFYKYNYNDGMKVVMLLEALDLTGVSVIGGLLKRGHSNNDIDIYIANHAYNDWYRKGIMKALGVREHIITDWGSLYLRDTRFGTLDIFFKGQTDKFDY